MHRNPLLSLVVCAGIAAAGSAASEESGLGVELNALAQEADACRVTFVARNLTGQDIDHAVFETVIFTTQGSVATLTLFDFQALPDGRPRVPWAQYGSAGR